MGQVHQPAVFLQPLCDGFPQTIGLGEVIQRVPAVRGLQKGVQHGPGGVGIELKADLPEALPVGWILAQAQHGQQLPGEPVAEQQGVGVLPQGKIDTGRVQGVGQGHGAVVGAVEDAQSGVQAQKLGPVHHIIGLARPVGQLNALDFPALLAKGYHVLGIAALVLADKAVGGRHNFPARAEVSLHAHHLAPGEQAFKGQQGLGIGGPKAVDALILVAHHHQMVMGRGQLLKDIVLKQGDVLGLVQLDIADSPLKILKQRAVLEQRLAGEFQHIVVIHPVQAGVFLVVGPKQRLEIQGQLAASLVQARGDQRVFAVANILFQLLKVFLRGIGIGQLGGNQRAQQLHPFPGFQKLKRLARHPAPPGLQQAIAQRMDGLEPGQGTLVPEQRLIARRHIPGRGPVKAHGQNGLGPHPVQDELARPAHDDRGLAAARHREQKRRPTGVVHGLALLIGEANGVLLFKLAEKVHVLLPGADWLRNG